MTDVVIEDIDEEDAQPKRGFWAEVRSLAFLLLGVLLVRTLLFQPFTIPSESMEPNLLKGDYIIVSKFATGYGEHAAWPFPFPVGDRLMKRGPERGDVVVFRPRNSSQDFIKRVIGLPGDKVEVRNHRVLVNGIELPLEGQTGGIQSETVEGREYAVQHLDGANARPAIPDRAISSVPAGQYFVLGDNRDRSADSRVEASRGGAGLVLSKDIVGEAKFVLLSVKDDFSLLKPWTWYRVRGDRWFKAIR